MLREWMSIHNFPWFRLGVVLACAIAWSQGSLTKQMVLNFLWKMGII